MTPIKRANIFFLAIAWLYLAAGCTGTSSDEDTQDKQPNILFIMTDDHASRAISALGSDLIETPNIDRIATGGIVFNNAFVTNSICGPSRAVLLTGKHSHINGFRDNAADTVFDGSQQTFPKLLQQAGYQTGVVGKWHLGSDPTGFDHWEVLIGQGEYYSPRIKSADGIVQYDGGYVTDVVTDLVLKFLDQRDNTKPFALLYHHKAPHRNWMPDVALLPQAEAGHEYPIPETFEDDYAGRIAAEHQDMRIADMYLGWDMKLQPGDYPKETGTGGYRHADGFDPNRSVQRWAAAFDRMTDEQKATWQNYYKNLASEYAAVMDEPDKRARWMYQRYMHDYLGTVRSVDNNIGRVLDYLDENDLSDNTIVIYTSDQGFYLGEHGWFDKRFMYEESMSTPLLMRYPGVIEPGTKTDRLVQNLDFAPTFIDLAGLEVPEDIQGRSLRPLFTNTASDRSTEAWRTAVYYEYFEYPRPHAVMPHYGVRTETHKLIRFQGQQPFWELYDLTADPGEMDNRYDDPALADIQMSLHKELDELRALYEVQ